MKKQAYLLSFFAFLGIIFVILICVLNNEHKLECQKAYEKGYREAFQNFSITDQSEVRRVIIEKRDTMVIVWNKFYKP